jgi:fumarylpyruvate hydrolase
MTGFVLHPPPQASVAVHGQDARFPVRRIFCVGRNYAEHAREMGHDPEAEPPFFFTKPADALVPSGAVIDYPQATADLHHEAELVVAIGAARKGVTDETAMAMVWGFAAGNDLTRRDLQAEAKAARRPWDMSKGFDQSAVIGALHPGQTVPQGRLKCLVNGAVRQDAEIKTMIWPVSGIIAHLSRLVALAPGDLIYTGTPAGVGALHRGDVCSVEIDGLSPAIVTLR